MAVAATNRFAFADGRPTRHADSHSLPRIRMSGSAMPQKNKAGCLAACADPSLKTNTLSLTLNSQPSSLIHLKNLSLNPQPSSLNRLEQPFHVAAARPGGQRGGLDSTQPGIQFADRPFEISQTDGRTVDSTNNLSQSTSLGNNAGFNLSVKTGVAPAQAPSIGSPVQSLNTATVTLYSGPLLHVGVGI